MRPILGIRDSRFLNRDVRTSICMPSRTNAITISIWICGSRPRNVHVGGVRTITCLSCGKRCVSQQYVNRTGRSRDQLHDSGAFVIRYASASSSMASLASKCSSCNAQPQYIHGKLDMKTPISSTNTRYGYNPFTHKPIRMEWSDCCATIHRIRHRQHLPYDVLPCPSSD